MWYILGQHRLNIIIKISQITEGLHHLIKEDHLLLIMEDHLLLIMGDHHLLIIEDHHLQTIMDRLNLDIMVTTDLLLQAIMVHLHHIRTVLPLLAIMVLPLLAIMALHHLDIMVHLPKAILAHLLHIQTNHLPSATSRSQLTLTVLIQGLFQTFLKWTE
jgi:hypothetical protein